MTIKASTLRPGLLVSLKTSVVGNVDYIRSIIEPERITETGTQTARWETVRTIIDPVEYETARVARGKARTAIARVCANSAFGFLCPEADAELLDAAITEARGIVDEFNAGAKLSRVSIYVMTGRIAPDDVEAVRAINSEIRELMADMETGLKNLDVKAVREAANKARSLGSMLSPEAGGRVTAAIEEARSAARRLVQAGETGAVEVDLRAIKRIAEQRTSFLDLDGAGEVAAPAPEQRALDLAPAAPPAPVKAAPRAALDLAE